MNSASTEQAHLKALLAVLAEPARAADLAVDDPSLIAVARRHRLTPLLSIAAGDHLPPKLAETFRRDRVVTAARNMMLGQVAEECVRAFAEAGIRSIVLKGLAYEVTVYGTTGARPTSDVDLLVASDQRRPAFEVLNRLGFEPRAAAPGFDDPDYHEVAWTRRSVEVDLHMALAPLARCQIDYQAIWREAVPLRLGATEALTLAQRHAAVFQTLHMAIDHFYVPAIYLVDLARLLPGAAELVAARDLARAWRCERPLLTAEVLTRSFLDGLWGGAGPTPPARSLRIVNVYGTGTPPSRPEQMRRKFQHFDTATDGIRYFFVQSRRNVLERFERVVRRRSARERLRLRH